MEAEHPALNPFQALRLPTSATHADIVERREELDTGAEQSERMLHRQATEELITHYLTRLEHELFEVPETDYEDSLTERFLRTFKRVSMQQTGLPVPPEPGEIEQIALLERVLELLLTVPEGDLPMVVRQQPFALPSELPLGVRDVIF